MLLWAWNGAAVELVTGDRESADDRVAAIVRAAIAEAAARQPQVVLGVVGGRSVGGIYRRLAASPELPWSHVHVFLADERLVPITSDESNFKLVHADLVAPVAGFPASNAHALDVEEAQPGPGIDRYGEALARLGGRFDVAILSAGEDGHCASLFPRHPALRDPGDRFVLVEGSPKPPPRRMSASLALLERTPLGVMVFYGPDKREALAKFRDPAVALEDCPSKVVQRMARGVVATDLGSFDGS